MRDGVVLVCQYPGVGTTKFSPKTEDFGHNRFANSLALICRCDANFIDPQFGRFVGVNVMDSGGESDHDAIHQRDHDVMTRVIEKFPRQFFVHGVVEDIVRGVEEEGEVNRGEGFDGEHYFDCIVGHGEQMIVGQIRFFAVPLRLDIYNSFNSFKSSSDNFQPVLEAFAVTCSGLVAPAMTEGITSLLSNQAKARS